MTIPTTAKPDRSAKELTLIFDDWQRGYTPHVFGADDKAPGPQLTQGECEIIAEALRSCVETSEATEDDIAAVIVAAQTSNSSICAAALQLKFRITRRASSGERQDG